MVAVANVTQSCIVELQEQDFLACRIYCRQAGFLDLQAQDFLTCRIYCRQAKFLDLQEPDWHTLNLVASGSYLLLFLVAVPTANGKAAQPLPVCVHT